MLPLESYSNAAECMERNSFFWEKTCNDVDDSLIFLNLELVPANLFIKIFPFLTVALILNACVFKQQNPQLN